MAAVDEYLSRVDWRAHRRRLVEIIAPHQAELLRMGHAAGTEAAGVDIAFDLHNPRVRDTLEGLARRIGGIADTTRDDIRGVLARVLDADEVPSTAEIARRLRETGGDVSRSRAQTIARTETATAFNQGAILGYADAGVERVECLDSDNDPECAERNGRIFTLEEAQAIEPHPNCVLAWAPVVD